MTRKIRTNTRKGPKTIHQLRDGPWEGHAITLDSSGDGNTGWIKFGEHVGRYARGKWEAKS